LYYVLANPPLIRGYYIQYQLNMQGSVQNVKADFNWFVTTGQKVLSLRKLQGHIYV